MCTLEVQIGASAARSRESSFRGYGSFWFRYSRAEGENNLARLFRLEAAAEAGMSLTWTPKVCKIMAFWATFEGLGP